MAARNLTLTSIGLPIRTELRLKSMLEVVKNMTVDNWTYSQDGAADLAICEPTSALTAVAIKRSQSAGATRCALLIREDSTEAQQVPIIRDPVRPTDFLALLNSISQHADVSREGASPSDAIDLSGAQEGIDQSPFALALALRAAAIKKSEYVVRLQFGPIEVHVLPQAKSAMLSKELEAVDISELGKISEPLNADELNPEYIERLQQHLVRTSVGGLLWKLGVHGPRDRLVPSVRADSLFKLKRWPDFGRLEHTADHLRMAARLSRQFASAADMAAAIGQPLEKVRPFLNACVLCELMVVQAAPASAPRAAEGKQAVPAPSRYKGLFHSIRSALNFALS